MFVVSLSVKSQLKVMVKVRVSVTVSVRVSKLFNQSINQVRVRVRLVLAYLPTLRHWYGVSVIFVSPESPSAETEISVI